MITGFYTGASGMYYNEQKLSVIANNMANVDTTGFRKAWLMFRTREENQYTKWIDTDVKKRLPSFYGIEREGVFKNYTPGRAQATDNPMDVAITSDLENAFFAVKGKDPNDKNTYYTRNGTLSFGLLDSTNPESPTILKISDSPAANANGDYIYVDPAQGPLNITLDGSIYQAGDKLNEFPIYRMNKSQDANVREDSPLAAFMQKGDSLFEIPPLMKDQFNPIRLRVGVDGVTRLTEQGVREQSNVNIINELVAMMDATKATAANTQAMTQQTGTLTKLFNLVRAD